MVMTNNFLLTYGTDKVAAMGIALKVNMITALVLVGFAFGGQPLVGYNYGAKNEKRLNNSPNPISNKYANFRIFFNLFSFLAP